MVSAPHERSPPSRLITDLGLEDIVQLVRRPFVNVQVIMKLTVQCHLLAQYSAKGGEVFVLNGLDDPVSAGSCEKLVLVVCQDDRLVLER